MRVDTEVFNNEPLGGPVPDPLPLVVGDWLNPSGELDTFTRAPGANALLTPSATGVGPPVASFLGSLGFFGFDEAAGVDYAFTQVPLPPPNATTGSFVFVSGVLVVLHSQNVLLTLIGADPIRFQVPSGGSNTFTRYFGVGDGSPSNAVDLENEVRAVATGTLQGCVSVAGTPGRRGARQRRQQPLLSTAEAGLALPDAARALPELLGHGPAGRLRGLRGPAGPPLRGRRADPAPEARADRRLRHLDAWTSICPRRARCA